MIGPPVRGPGYRRALRRQQLGAEGEELPDGGGHREGLRDATCTSWATSRIELPSVTHHEFLADRGALFELLGRARCVVCPSHIDAAPGVLFEASAMGCNVVASRNCGNWELCHSDLLADPVRLDRFAECSRRALRKKYVDNLEVFLARASYADFVRTLEAFGRPFEPRAEP